MKSTRVLIRAKGRGLCIERGLYDCLQKELFADVALHCNGRKIRANKGVLAAASPVLCYLLKDWPLTDDPCIIMAGYTVEEVQGLVRYIYTGQLTAPQVQGSSWEKIIEDFKIGSPIEHDDDLASIHELTDYGEASPVYEPEANGVCHLQQPHQQAFHSARSPAKGVGPKIVAVTSPRPLIVQVQSLTQPQAINHGLDLTSSNDVNDIPNEMTVDEAKEELAPEAPVPSIVGKRRLGRGGKVLKRLQRSKQTEESLLLTVPPVSVAALKKLAPKRAKPSSKFARKKYACPHCSRRFLTRGNIKNHLRIHSRDKPFQCPICQDLFSYQGVYQRHLMKHCDNNEIGDSEVAPMIADSLRLADEIGILNKKSIHVVDEEEQDLKKEPEKNEPQNAENNDPTDAEKDENAELMVDENAELMEDEGAELMEDEEAKIALKLKDKTKVAGSSETIVSSDEKVDSDNVEGENDTEGEAKEVKGKVTRKRDSASNSVKGKQNAPAARKQKKPPKPRANYHYQVIECDFCPMRYHKWSAFYIHRCTHTGETPVIPCSICEMEFPNIKALKEHKVKEHRESIFPCEGCSRTFLSKSALLLHQPVHSTDLNYQCRSCPEKMRTFRERYVHERTHTTAEETQTPHQCSHCQKQFNTLVNLRYHLKLCGKEVDSSTV